MIDERRNPRRSRGRFVVEIRLRILRLRTLTARRSNQGKADPTTGPVWAGLDVDVELGSGSAQPFRGDWFVVRVASGQKSLELQEIPFGGAAIRLAGTRG